MAAEGVEAVVAEIDAIMRRRKVMVLALANRYAGLALQEFRKAQLKGKEAEGLFWTNRTGLAAGSVFSGAEEKDGNVTFGLAHKMGYGVYLELANDRKHESIRPILFSLYPAFMKDLEEIFS